MTTTKVDFSSVKWRSVEWTNVCALPTRVRKPVTQPVLGSHAAAEAVDRIDFDFKRIPGRATVGQPVPGGLTRQAQLDDWTVSFLDKH